MIGTKKVDFNYAVLNTDITYTDIVTGRVHVLKAGTQITINAQRQIGCDGDFHFEIFPFQYDLVQKYAC